MKPATNNDLLSAYMLAEAEIKKLRNRLAKTRKQAKLFRRSQLKAEGERDLYEHDLVKCHDLLDSLGFLELMDQPLHDRLSVFIIKNVQVD
ncbi:MAG: hypothetical protein KDH96_09965 [Candidatus Riesia sp.]|nr:hypothetical protein [Candidatus Riesia sp.]